MNKTNTIKFILLVTFVSILTTLQYGCLDQNINESTTKNQIDSLLTPISTIEYYTQQQTSNKIVTVKGNVTKILSDDTDGDKHQRFIIRISNNHTLLIVHNIDIAPRIENLKVNDVVYVHGEYVWNDQGGLVHWTHHDPDEIHENGWIVINDKKYQ
ncbi:MAG: DUF3465 domain-containing protein [Fibrobacter sp.]|nr:DUF3465 domain-containing protein [Fibrobacter sp.]